MLLPEYVGRSTVMLAFGIDMAMKATAILLDRLARQASDRGSSRNPIRLWARHRWTRTLHRDLDRPRRKDRCQGPLERKDRTKPLLKALGRADQ